MLALLAKLETRAGRYGWPIVGLERGALLEKIVRKCRPRRALEIGTLVGFSAILIARNLPLGGRLTCVEISGRYARVARRNAGLAGLGKRISVREGDALKVIPKLKGIFDFVYLDAVKEDYIRYLRLLEKNGNVAKGTVIAADNARKFAGEMACYLKHVRKSGNYRSRYLEAGGDAIEESAKL